MLLIGIIGLGFVGNALHQSFLKHGIETRIYDKYKKIGSFESLLDSNIVFLNLPTNLNEKKLFNKDEIIKTCDELNNKQYNGIVVIKSTLEPYTTNTLQEKYPNLTFIHNPEFLSAKTAEQDFHNQNHIVLGKSFKCSENEIMILYNFYSEYYPDSQISICSSIESEAMKIFCNSFYSVKIQFFNELYDYCKKSDINYDIVKDLMLKNNWINPMHTNVPGPDGELSFGGACLPKDMEALLTCMKLVNSRSIILESTLNERNSMRK